MSTPEDGRAAIRAGELDGPTAALAPGFTQANLVVLPEADAFDFLRFCVANPRPCPVLEVLEPGSVEPVRTAPGGDLRTDLPRYRVYERGELVAEPTSVGPGHPRDEDHVPVRVGARPSRCTSATHPRSGSPRSRCPSTATRSRSVATRSRCSGRAA